VDSLQKVCGSSEHQIQMDSASCGSREEDCNRTFHLYIPERLCDNDDSSTNSVASIGTIPLVFAVHCFSCNAQAMAKFEAIAKEFNFVLVRPEGVESSWNAKYCCGYALDQKLDDIGFFGRIIDNLDASFEFVNKEMVYGVGWSNGGYMVTYSAHLFRSIAPIAGYQYGDFEAINHGTPTGLFQHHSLNDPVVSFNGCCSNTTMKKCCCGISKQGGDQCTSVDQAFEDWATKVNGCSGSATTTYIDNGRGIECRSGDDCSSNTTLCVHKNSEHFNPFSKGGFPMFNEIGDFFARDACLMNEGNWHAKSKLCSCADEQSSWMYCSALTITSDKHADSTSVVFTTGSIVIVIAVFTLMMPKRWKRCSINMNQKKKQDGWESVPSEEPKEIELR